MWDQVGGGGCAQASKQWCCPGGGPSIVAGWVPQVEAMMEIERYSHVMHISSTVTGKLVAGLGVWDVLRAALPAGTVSGAPKVAPPPLLTLPRSTLATAPG